MGSKILFNLIVAHGMMLTIPSVSESSFFGLLAFAEDHVVRLDPRTILAESREGDSVYSLRWAVKVSKVCSNVVLIPCQGRGHQC